MINDVEKVQFAISTVMAEFLQQFFTLIFTVVRGGGAGRQAGLGAGCVYSFHRSLPSRKIGRRVRQTTRSGQDKLAEIQNILHETVTGNRIVKAFGMEGWESSRFYAAARKLFRANLRSVAAQAISSPLMDIIGAVAIALLLWVGRNQIKGGAFTNGTFLAFIVAVFKLYDPVRKFASFNNSFQQALGASEEMFRFLDEHDEIPEKPGAMDLPAFRERVRFEDVSFSYCGDSGTEPEILRGINLETRAGEIIAIVGSSGAGKSTLVHLIPRFFDVTSGAIKIDGHDIRDVNTNSLRAQIGIVTQETILFNDSVRNNIAYGQPHVTAKR